MGWYMAVAELHFVQEMAMHVQKPVHADTIKMGPERKSARNAEQNYMCSRPEAELHETGLERVTNYIKLP